MAWFLGLHNWTADDVLRADVSALRLSVLQNTYFAHVVCCCNVERECVSENKIHTYIHTPTAAETRHQL